MGRSFHPLWAALGGLLAAGFFTTALGHWMALVHATLAKHTGNSLGPPRRRLIAAAPFVLLLHPVPYFMMALIVISILTIFGAMARSWLWFLGPFYAYVAFMAVVVGNVSIRKQQTPRTRKAVERIWPFNLIERHRYERQYRAALTILLIEGTFAKLSDQQQTDIINRVNRLLLEWGVDAYAYPPRSPFLALVYAAQMSALGIPPALEGERWPLPKECILPLLDDPKSWTNAVRLAPPRPLKRLLREGLVLLMIYRRGGRGVEDARRDVTARGLEMPTPPAFRS